MSVLYGGLRVILHQHQGVGFKRFISLSCSKCSVNPKQSPQDMDQSTVSDQDVQNHGNLAKVWWDVKGPMKALHSMNDVRVPFIRNGLIMTGVLNETDLTQPEYLKGLNLLDVGCGGGILSMPLARLGANVTGLDPGQQVIEVARAVAQQEPSIASNANFVQASIEDFAPSHPQEFDAVILSEVVEHVKNPQVFLDLCCSTVKPGGSVFVTTINKTTLSYYGAIVFAEYVLNLLPQGTHDWNKFISPEDLEKMLINSGCSTLLINGMAYIPFRNSWHWTSVTSINYALHAKKL